MPKGPITWTDDDVMAQLEAKDKRIEELEGAIRTFFNDSTIYGSGCGTAYSNLEAALGEKE